MRKGLLGIVASATMGAGTAAAQAPYVLTTAPEVAPARASVAVGPPTLLPAGPEAAPPATAEPSLTGGSTGLRPGLDCLPQPCDVGSKGRFYGDVDYLLLWFQRRNLPPLIAAGPPSAVFNPGVPGTFVLYGGNETDFGAFNAVQATAGYWLDPQRHVGIEAGGFVTEQRVVRFAAFNDGATTNALALGRVDFTSPVLGIGPSVGVPGILRGSESVAEKSRLWSAEGNVVVNWREQCQSRIDLLAGFRYLDLSESLSIHDATQSLLFPTTVIERTDEFGTRNQFYGGQVGSRTLISRGPLTLTLIGKLALGVTHQAVERNGGVQLGNGFSSDGGYLVPPENVGRDTTDHFAIVSESAIRLGYQWTPRLQTFVGYDFLYVSSVARPASQIFQGGASGGALARGIDVDDFYANGLQLGLAYNW